MGKVYLPFFLLGWDPKSPLHLLSPAFQPSLKVLHASPGGNTIFTHLGIQLHPLRAPRSCCLGSIRRWSGCSAQPGEVAGSWQGLQRKAERYGLSLARRLPRDSIADVRIEQLAAFLQKHVVLAEMLGTGDEVRSYPWPGKAQGTKQE